MKIYYNAYKSRDGKVKCTVHKIINNNDEFSLALERRNKLLKKVIYKDNNKSVVDEYNMKKLYSDEQIDEINKALNENIQNNIYTIYLNAGACIYRIMERDGITL
jgi:hypothetical protein